MTRPDTTRTPRRTSPGIRMLASLLVVSAAACGDSGDDDIDASSTGDTSSIAPETTSAGEPTTTAPTTTVPATTTATTITATSTTAPPATTTAPPTTTTVEPTTTMPAATTTAPDPEAACRAWFGVLSEVLDDTAVALGDGGDASLRLLEGTLSESDAAVEFVAISERFVELGADLAALGEPPVSAAPAATLVRDSLELFHSAYELTSRGAADGDDGLIDQGAARIEEGANLLGQVPDAIPDCSALAATDTSAAELAVPAEVDLTVYFRVAESVLGRTAYAGIEEAVLVAGAQAACAELLAGGDVRSAVEAAIAASPVADRELGAEEQTLVLLMVTRGSPLWCPSAVADPDAFGDEVASAIVDIFFDG